MELTQTAEYALRAMTYLAALPADRPARAREMTSSTRIPPSYLSKILRRLVEAGLLLSQKGHGGGFQLARRPERIRFVDILDAVDYGTDPNRCAFGWGECAGDHPCPLHDAWSAMKSSFRAWAAETTLADLGPASVGPDGVLVLAPAASGARAPRRPLPAARAKRAAARRGGERLTP